MTDYEKKSQQDVIICRTIYVDNIRCSDVKQFSESKIPDGSDFFGYTIEKSFVLESFLSKETFSAIFQLDKKPDIGGLSDRIFRCGHKNFEVGLSQYTVDSAREKKISSVSAFELKWITVDQR
jgi:hypothetical protein